MCRKREILVVDDEAMIRDVISSYLEKKGFCVFAAETGEQALQIFKKRQISFVILDLMLPDLSGEEICMEIRRRSRTPVIMLTAKAMEEDVLGGLQLGADDYMTKPFSLRELYARMEAVYRRTGETLRPLAQKFLWNGGDLEIDFDKRTARKKGLAVGLTPIEWKILEALVGYPQKVFTREELILGAFDTAFDGCDRVIDTHIKNLRKKIEDDPKNPVYLRTVHGIGYQFGGEAV